MYVVLNMKALNSVSVAQKTQPRKRFTFWGHHNKWTQQEKPKGQQVDSLWASEL